MKILDTIKNALFEVEYVEVPADPKKAKKEYTEDEIIAGLDNEPSGATVISLDSVNPHTNDNYHDNQMSGAAAEAFAQASGWRDGERRCGVVMKGTQTLVASSCSPQGDIVRHYIYNVGCAGNAFDGGW